MSLMTRYIFVAATLLTLTACGNTDLTARGSVIATFEGAETGFRFTEDTRLEVPERDGTVGFITGGCQMAPVASADGEPAWGIIVDLDRGTNTGDNGLSRVTIMQRTDAAPTAARVEAELGMVSFMSGADGCSIEFDYATPDSGMIGMMGTCGVQDADGNTATVAVDLDIIGCTVLE